MHNHTLPLAIISAPDIHDAVDALQNFGCLGTIDSTVTLSSTPICDEKSKLNIRLGTTIQNEHEDIKKLRE